MSPLQLIIKILEVCVEVGAVRSSSPEFDAIHTEIEIVVGLLNFRKLSLSSHVRNLDISLTRNTQIELNFEFSYRMLRFCPEVSMTRNNGIDSRLLKSVLSPNSFRSRTPERRQRVWLSETTVKPLEYGHIIYYNCHACRPR